MNVFQHFLLKKSVNKWGRRDSGNSSKDINHIALEREDLRASFKPYRNLVNGRKKEGWVVCLNYADAKPTAPPPYMELIFNTFSILIFDPRSPSWLPSTLWFFFFNSTKILRYLDFFFDPQFFCQSLILFSILYPFFDPQEFFDLWCLFQTQSFCRS